MFPRRGARVWYDDQREVRRQIYAGDDVVDYPSWAPIRTRPITAGSPDAMQQQIPIIYFLGTSPGRYQPIIPTFIVGWHPERLQVQLAFGALVGASAQAAPPDAAPNADMRFVRSRRGCIRHRSGTRFSPLMGGAARFPIYPSRDCSMPPTSSWIARAVRSAGRLEWSTVDEAPPRGLRRPPDRRRPGLPNSRLRPALEIHDGPFLELGLKGIAGMIHTPAEDGSA